MIAANSTVVQWGLWVSIEYLYFQMHESIKESYIVESESKKSEWWKKYLASDELHYCKLLLGKRTELCAKLGPLCVPSNGTIYVYVCLHTDCVLILSKKLS